MFADLFIQKFSSSGQLLWSTYYGSNSFFSKATSVTVDINDDIWITGETNDPNFPLQNSGTYFQNVYGDGGRDGIILVIHDLQVVQTPLIYHC